jgi:hypothetical protein
VVSTAFAGNFSDVPADAYYYNAVETLASEGIIDASKTSFDPARQLQRQEAAKLIVESAGLVADLPEVASFTDVPKTLWSFESVETAKANGVVNGYSDSNGALTGKFGPTDTVTRAQFAKMVVEAFDLPMYTPDSPTFPDVMDTNAWYYEYVETAAYHGVVKGFADGSFGANKQIVRQDGAVMIYRALGMEVDPGDDDDMDDDIYVPGDIDISLGDTPASAVVPSNATRVPYLTMDVDGEGTIKSMTFERFGAGAPSDFDEMYLYEGDVRLTSGRTINSSTHRVTFTGLNYAVDGMGELTLMADMSGVPGNVNGFRLYEVVSDDNVSYGEIEGELMSVSGALVGDVTVARNGTLSDPKVGETDVKVAEFKLTASSVEALDVYSVTLYSAGTVSRSNITNFVLKQAGVEVATADGILANDTIVLTFDSPFALGKGDSKVFELYADIDASARPTETVKLYVENRADVYAIGSVYEYGVGVTNTAYDSTTFSLVTVQGGEVTVTYMGPAIQDYSVDSKDVELLRFSIVAQNDVEVRKTSLKIEAPGSVAGGLVDTTGAASANYTDIKLVDVDSGEILTGSFDVITDATNPAYSDTAQTKLLNDTWYLDAGEARTVKVTADISNFVAPASENVKVTLNKFSTLGLAMKNLSNNQEVTDIVPDANIVGNAHKVLVGGSTISKAGVPAAQQYINGSKGVDLLGLVIKADPGKDLKLTQLKVEVVGTDECLDVALTAKPCISSLYLYDGAKQLSNKSLDSASFSTFNNLDVEIPKGTSKTFLVKADLLTVSGLTAVPADTLRVDVATANVSLVSDPEGNTVPVSAPGVTGNTHTVLPDGTIAVSKAPNETNVTDSRILVAGTTGVTVAKFRFVATNEALKLSKVPVQFVDNPVNLLPVTTELTNVYLYDGSTKIAGPLPVDGTGKVVFQTLSPEFVVPKNGNKTLSVVADLNTIEDGAIVGQEITAQLLSDTAEFEVRSASGSNTTIYGDGSHAIPPAPVSLVPVDANTMVLRKASLTVNRVALTSTDLLNGTNDLYKFSVEVTPGKTAYLKQLVFDINKTTAGGSITGMELYRNNSERVAINTDFSNIGGTLYSLTFPTELSIDGTSTFTLRVDLAGYIKDENISASLVTDSKWVAGNLYIVPGPADVNGDGDVLDSNETYAGLLYLDDTDPLTLENDTAFFLWSDEGDNSHDPSTSATGDYANGYLLKNLPIGASSLTYR